MRRQTVPLDAAAGCTESVKRSGPIPRKTRLRSTGPIKRKGRPNRKHGKPVPRKREVVNGVIKYSGREVCDDTAAGRAEYKRRVEAMWERQNGLCGLRISPLCPGRIELTEATFEHQDGRGAGGSKRDDRIMRDGKPYNLAACWWCNGAKSSRSLDAVMRDARLRAAHENSA